MKKLMRRLGFVVLIIMISFCDFLSSGSQDYNVLNNFGGGGTLNNVEITAEGIKLAPLLAPSKSISDSTIIWYTEGSYQDGREENISGSTADTIDGNFDTYYSLYAKSRFWAALPWDINTGVTTEYDINFTRHYVSDIKFKFKIQGGDHREAVCKVYDGSTEVKTLYFADYYSSNEEHVPNNEIKNYTRIVNTYATKIHVLFTVPYDETIGPGWISLDASIDIYEIQPVFTEYSTSGVFASLPSPTLENIAAWGDFEVDHTLPTGTNIIYQTSTSNDKGLTDPWTTFVDVTNPQQTAQGTWKYTIQSPVKKHIQWQASLNTTDVTKTPLFRSLRINYQADTIPVNITNMYVNPNPFSPTNDGVKDTTTLSYTLSEPATVDVLVEKFQPNGGGSFTITPSDPNQTRTYSFTSDHAQDITVIFTAAAPPPSSTILKVWRNNNLISDLSISYSDEPVTKIYSVNRNDQIQIEISGSYLINTTGYVRWSTRTGEMRTIVSGVSRSAGNNTEVWDGKYDSGTTAAAGNYPVSIIAVDGSNNRTEQSIEVTIDKDPPSIPAVQKLTLHQRPQWNIDVIDGTANSVEPNSVVTVYSNETLTQIVGTAQADSTGSFPPINLGDNLYNRIYVTATDIAGNRSTAIMLDNDITPPAVPNLVSPLNNVIINYTPQFDWSDVTDVNNVKYTLEVSDFPDFTAIPVVWQNNLVTSNYTYPGSKPDGQYYWRVNAIDGVGNASSVTTAWSFIIDTVLPAVPSSLILHQNSPGTIDTIEGTANSVEPNSLVTVYSNEALTQIVGTAQADIYGSFPSINLGDNLYSRIYVTAMDSAGNRSTATILDNDITAPAAPSSLILHQNPPGTIDTIEGTANSVEPNSLVTVYSNDTLTLIVGTAQAGSTGSFPSINLGANLYSRIYVTATDSAGNRSTAIGLDNDITPPAVPNLVSPLNNVIINYTPLFDWSDVTDISGVTYKLEVDNNSDFSLPEINQTNLTVSNYTYPAGYSMSDGQYYWRVRAIDGVGNASSVTQAWSFVIDTIVPSLPTSISLHQNPPGAIDTIEGTANSVEPNSLVTVYSNEILTLIVGTAQADSTGSFLPINLGDNSYNRIYVTATDIAGNRSTAIMLDNDITAPTTPSSLILHQNPPNTIDTIEGTANSVEPNSLVTVYSNEALTQIVGTAQADSTGSFLPINLGDNSYNRIYVTATDSAGNRSTAIMLENDITEPTPGSLLLPADNATFYFYEPATSIQINFQWYYATDDLSSESTLKYRFEVDDNYDFSSSFVVEGTGFYFYSYTFSVNTFWWRVKITDQAGNYSYSPVRSFVVISQKSFYCTKDAYVDSNNPTANYGTADKINVYFADINTVFRGLVSFNLIEIPADAIILSASIFLNTDIPILGNLGSGIDIHYHNSSWEETGVNGINWNTHSIGDKIGSLRAYSDSASSIENLSIKIQRWIDNPATNYGLVLKKKLEIWDNRQIKFLSNNSIPYKQARLNIFWSRVPFTFNSSDNLVTARSNIPNLTLTPLTVIPEGISYAIQNANSTLVGNIYDINPSGLLSTPSLLYFSYPDSNNDGIVDGTNINENNIFLYRFKNSTPELVPLQVRSNTNNVITAQVYELSLFGILVDNTPPSAPTLISPSNNSLLSYGYPYFNWNEVTDISSVTYQINISTETSFSDTLIFFSTVTYLNLGELDGIMPGLGDGTYYWRVKAVDGAQNESNWSDVWSFNVMIPPNNVTDLVVQPDSNPAGVTLTWTSPGDDGTTGTAAEYDIRYSLAQIDESNWATATQVTGEPTPQTAGTPQSFTVGGLVPGVTYYFALKTRDDATNESGISNVTSTYATPGNWSFEFGNLSKWTVFGNVEGGVQTQGSFYNIPAQSGTYYFGTSTQWQVKNGGLYQRISTQPGKNYKASCYIRTLQNGGVFTDVSCRIGIDPTGGTDNTSGNIAWSVWASNEGAWIPIEISTTVNSTVVTVFLEQWHKWALERNVNCFDNVEFVPIDSVAPAAVNNLSGQPGSTGGQVLLSWTSPGDDVNIGTATEYDIRYSLSSITESNWSNATQVTGEPTPLVAGSQQTFTIGSLTPGGTYYFSLKTRDEVSNWSVISNIAQTYANPWISGGNWGFELGNLTNWTVWGSVDGVQTDGYYGFNSQDGDGKFLGTSAQWQTKNGGVYQRVSAVSGRNYKASCYIRTYQNGGANWDTLCRIGIDPTGGTNPSSGNVVWAGWWDSVGSWTYREITATANGSAVTVFLEQWHKYALERNVTCFDKVELIDLGGGQGAPMLSFDPRMAILNDAEATEFKLRDSYVSPNPSIVEGNNRVYASLPGGVRGAPSRSGGIRLAMFVGLADKVRARVYTVAGELVYEGELDGSEYTILQGKDNKPGIGYVINWSGINKEGTKVIPGVYICIMDAEKRGYQSLRKSSKLAIIK